MKHLLLISFLAFTLTSTQSAQPRVLGTEVVASSNGSATNLTVKNLFLTNAAAGSPLRLGSDGSATNGVIDISTSDITGNLSIIHLDSGTSASSSTYWRGDGVWATPSGGSGSQTPLAQNVNGAGFALTNINYFSTAGSLDSSGESRYLINDTRTGTGNGHGFADDTIFSRAGYAYNSLDLNVTFSDSIAYDHYAGIQPRVNLGLSSSFNNVYLIGASTVNTVGSGSIVTNLYSFYVPPVSNNGSISNYYGIYFGGIPSGTLLNSYGIYIANGGGFFGGSTTYKFVAGIAANSLVVTNTVTFSGVTGQTLLGVNSGKSVISITPGPGMNWNTTLTLLATVSSKSSTYTIVTPTDRATTFKNASGALAVTLPASPTTGDYFDFIQASNGNNLSMAAGSAILIDGTATTFTTFTSSVRGSTCRLLWDGTNWVVMWKNGTWTTS